MIAAREARARVAYHRRMGLDVNKLGRAMTRIVGQSGSVEQLVRLTGGASMESWSFAFRDVGYVLRRAPADMDMTGRPFTFSVEAALIRTARVAGVLAPQVVGELEPADDIGSGYVMIRVEADVRPDRILANASPNLLDDLAHQLARIHAIPVSAAPGLPMRTVSEILVEMNERFESYGGDRPVLALALRWLHDHQPAPCDQVLLHGDFRLGNLMVDGNGLAAVLDWELAHLGDRHDDLVWGCVNSWRFGQIDRPAFGLGDLATYWAAYELHSGVPVDPERFRFWLVYRTFWWAMCCLGMADIWRTGQDPSLERVVIGRRCSEAEVDLLLLLEHDAPESERGPVGHVPAQRGDGPVPSQARRLGEPSTLEVLEAVASWIADEVRPNAKGRDRFLASVALNALGIAARETANPVAVHDRMLCDDVLSGRIGLSTPGLLVQLKVTALKKLANDQPSYSAYDAARAAWGAQP